MNYQYVYNLLVQKAKNREEVPHIKERHHILPKSMGGTNKKENIVFFTPKEHYVAHHLLWKIYRNREMHYAFWLMVTKCSKDGRRNYTVNSRTYTLAKEQHRIEVSKVHTGKIVSEETRKKSSKSLMGKLCWAKGLTGIHSKEGLGNIRKSSIGRKDSLETQKKRSESAKLRPMAENIYSEESKRKRNESNEKWREDNQIKCPHCNKIGVKYNMERYHFDNCKIINPDRKILSKSKGITLKKHKCTYCSIETSMGNLRRWHLENCREK